METDVQPDRAPITVVLLNYNGGDAVLRCIRSLARQTLPPQRILFVDNGSDSYDEAALRFAFGTRLADALRFERLEKNVGYAKGMNHGLGLVLSDVSSPPWVMTLSNDTEFDPEFFSTFDAEIARMDLSGSQARIKMLAPKLRAMNDRERLDGAGLALSLDGMSTARGQRELDECQYDSDTHILIPNGVAAIYSTDLLREIGLLDEQFWAYCEDTDLGLRAWLAGSDCHFLPECIVYHARSTTLGEHSINKLYLVERNHYWVALKNLPLPLLLLNPTLSTYRYLVQAYALASQSGQGKGFGEGYPPHRLATTTLKAIVDAGIGAPRILAKRVSARRHCRRTLLEQLYTLWRKRLSFSELILK